MDVMEQSVVKVSEQFFADAEVLFATFSQLYNSGRNPHVRKEARVQFLRESAVTLESMRAAILGAVQFIEMGDPVCAVATEEKQ